MKANGTGPLGRQDYGTPTALLDAVRARFGRLDWDLAARADNAVCANYISPQQDSLKTKWEGFDFTHRVGGPINLWLNPPFKQADEFAAKCAEWYIGSVHPQSRLLFLVPASVDSNWWRDFVSAKARVLSLAPRLTFVGCDDPYPKPMALCVYEPCWPEQPRIMEPWNWKAQMKSLVAGWAKNSLMPNGLAIAA